MGAKQLRSVIPELITERSCFFIREEDGTYSRIEKYHTRDTRTNALVEESENQSHLRYTLVSGEEYDEIMIIQDHDGNNMTLKFKLVVDQ